MYNSQLVINRIDALLSMSGMPKARLNEYCNISRNTLSQSKDQPNGLSAKILYDAADFLNCSVDYLLGRTDVVTVSDRETLTDDERELLSAFRDIPEKDKQRIIGRVQTIAEQTADITAEQKDA